MFYLTQSFSFESIYHVVNQIWASGGFHRPMGHPNYAENLKNCAVTITSKNVG